VPHHRSFPPALRHNLPETSPPPPAAERSGECSSSSFSINVFTGTTARTVNDCSIYEVTWMWRPITLKVNQIGEKEIISKNPFLPIAIVPSRNYL
jgi:hypothetical protein